mmetsp:Transcript_31892/g.52611  ORF Transcript_31892/g.52611 Transcript_31892/m.52611 type:complete len:89 (-) Transcript_31892:773-1039(-)
MCCYQQNKQGECCNLAGLRLVRADTYCKYLMVHRNGPEKQARVSSDYLGVAIKNNKIIRLRELLSIVVEPMRTLEIITAFFCENSCRR